jgi:hypothetical protein
VEANIAIEPRRDHLARDGAEALNRAGIYHVYRGPVKESTGPGTGFFTKS